MQCTFGKRHTHGACIVVACLGGDVLQNAVHHILRGECNEVAKTTTDKALEHEHVTKHGKVRFGGEVECNQPVTFLQCQVPRFSVECLRHFKPLERIVASDALADAPLYNSAEFREDIVERILRTPCLCQALVELPIEIGVLLGILMFMHKIVVEITEVAGGYRVNGQAIVRLLLHHIAESLETLYLMFDATHGNGLALVKILRLDVLFYQDGELHLLRFVVHHLVGVGMVEHEDEFLQPFVVCPDIVFLVDETFEVNDGIVETLAFLFGNKHHTVLASLTLHVPIGRVDGQFGGSLHVELPVTEAHIDGCLVLVFRFSDVCGYVHNFSL